MSNAVVCGKTWRVEGRGADLTEYLVSSKKSDINNSMTIGPFTADSESSIEVARANESERVKSLMAQYKTKIEQICPKTEEANQRVMSLLDGASFLGKTDWVCGVWENKRMLTIVYFANGVLLDPKKLKKHSFLKITSDAINALPIRNFFA